MIVSRSRIQIYLTVIYQLVIQCSCDEFDGPVSKIVGGGIVPDNLYPWFARSTKEGHVCGGMLIHPEYVLTAAHCVKKIDEFEAFGGFEIGSLCKRNDGPNNCGQFSEVFGVSKVFLHPEFDKETLENDYAVVKLDGISTITPVNIDTTKLSNSYENSAWKSGLWAVGFGLLEEGSQYLPNRLHHVELNYVKNEFCDSSHRNYLFDDDKMMCASAFLKDACGGDSGGPLYDIDNDVVVGVTSWGIGCAREDYPGVYSRISGGLSWIQSKVCSGDTTNEDGTAMSVCPCKETENRIRVETKDHKGKTVFRIKKKGKKLWQTKVRNNSVVNEFCVAKENCMSFQVLIKRGSGSYNVQSNGDMLIQDTIDGAATKKITFSCSKPEYNSPINH